MLRLIATIDREVALRAQKNQFDFSAFERSAREQFNNYLDELTDHYYPEPNLDRPYYFIVYNTEKLFLENLAEIMTETDYDNFLNNVAYYLDNPTHEDYLKLVSYFEPYKQLDGPLIITLLERFNYEQIKAFYQIDDQFNLVSQPIIDDSHTVKSGTIKAGVEKQIWQTVKQVIPPQYLKYFDSLLITTDGLGYNIASTVNVIDADGKVRWLIQVDDADIKDDLVISLLHILGNYLTLNDQQVKRENGFRVDRYCEPNLITNQDALLTDYYLRFWKDYVNVDLFQTSYQFYLRNQSDFVSSYAYSGASIDIAESFSYFVLREKPQGNSIAEQKIRFFYDYPQLVELRQTIRQSLADANLLADATLSAFMGTINQPTILTDNDTVKITLQEAYKSYEYDGLVARVSVENRSDKDVKFGFYHFGSNDKTFRPIQVEKEIAAGQTDIVTIKLVSSAVLRMAGIDSLNQLSLGCFYYQTDGQQQLVDIVEFNSNENLND